jgi:hypothetical protein
MAQFDDEVSLFMVMVACCTEAFPVNLLEDCGRPLVAFPYVGLQAWVGAMIGLFFLIPIVHGQMAMTSV